MGPLSARDALLQKKRHSISRRRFFHEARSKDYWMTWTFLGLGAFGGIFDFEADSLAFGQGLEAVTLDRSVMDEKILPILLLDEAVALLFVEPTSLALHPQRYPPFCIRLVRQVRIALRLNKKRPRGFVTQPNGHFNCLPKLPSDQSRLILARAKKTVNRKNKGKIRELLSGLKGFSPNGLY